MALRTILTDEDVALTKKSRLVTDFNERLHILIDDMRETLIEADGLGLAAPQIGVLRRVALIVDTFIESEDINDQIIELINPEIVETKGEQSGSEGCLSVPGVYGIVTRPESVTIKAMDRHGKEFTIDADMLTARAACHEIDHLDGVIFTTVAERLLTEEELAELIEQREKEQKEFLERQVEEEA